MKTNLLGPTTKQFLLASGASCLIGWLLGSSSALKANSLGTLASVAAFTHAAAPWPYPDSLDAVRAAPQFHRILLENDRVRVLEVTVPAHTREPVHTHRWPSVIYKEQTGRGRYYDATGKMVHESTKPYCKGPDLVRARWQEPETPHAVENTDEVADRFIRVELKQ